VAGFPQVDEEWGTPEFERAVARRAKETDALQGNASGVVKAV
jgi:hypothetical protein